jgi:hypothetical protein
MVVGRTTTIVISEREITYNGGDSKFLLLGVLEETEDVVTDDDT